MTRLTFDEMLLRVLMAFVAGTIIGWERETHGRPAGLRTTILTCIASALAMVLSELLFVQSASVSSSSWRPDPARLAAGILTGIGFLGAGTILRHANAIQGVTTAATLWFVTVLGLAFGSGQFRLGLLGTGLALATLFVLPFLEKRIPSDWYGTVTVTTVLDAVPVTDLKQRIGQFGAKIKATRVNYNLEGQQQTVICEVKMKKSRVPEISGKVLAELRRCPGVLRIRWF